MSLPQPTVATFDCYGTLVDWEGGAGAFLYQQALRQGEVAPPPGWALRERWEALQFALVQGAYRPYKAILAESLRQWLAERGAPWDPTLGESLVQAMRSWQPFPDTRPALARARAAGLRLAIVSNTDRDIIAHTLRQLALPFDEVVTAEDAGAYKPARPMFELALKRLGEPPERVLHVAFGFKYDIATAQELGCQTAWLNRHAEQQPPGTTPTHTWRDLWGLAALAEGATS